MPQTRKLNAIVLSSAVVHPCNQKSRKFPAQSKKSKSEIPIQICCSLGLLNGEQASQLKDAGVDRVNHNLNTSEAFHPSICSTHTYQDRVDTSEACHGPQAWNCVAGGIVGMGEKDEDLVDLALALKEVQPDSIPLNMLYPVDGTPFGEKNDLTPARCLTILCLFRFLHPQTEIRAAGGRGKKPPLTSNH